jgi:molybdenum cofactor cytidylyltransferase
MLGQLGASPVIGIPSCAASPKLNGFDWLLERVLTGADVTSIEIARMGVGGLLGEITSRPQPRAGSGSTPAEARRALRITCIVLAAGRSTRMGANKLLELVSGEPIVRTVATAARASAADRVVVVTGHQADAVGRALAGLDIEIVHNEAFADGLASSLRAGLAALDPDVDGVLVALGDMPDVSAQHMDRLIAAFSPADGRDIVVPVRHGKRGNPVLWARAYLPEMAALSGDTGAKHLLGRHDEAIVEVDLESDAVLADIDTPEALAALRRRRQRD